MTTSPSPSPARLPVPLFKPGQAVYWVDHQSHSPAHIRGSIVRDVVSTAEYVGYTTADNHEFAQDRLHLTFKRAQLAIPGYRG